MSSTFKSPHSVDAHRSSREFADDLGLKNNNNNIHLTNTRLEQSHLSPYYSHTSSNNTSPYNIGDAPVESISEYSYHPTSEFSDVDDPFFGVDFDAGVSRIDALPSAIPGNIAYSSVTVNPTQEELPPQAEPQSATDTLTTTSTYPLSPRHTSIPNTPSPRSEVNDLKTKTTISHHELITGLHTSRSSAFSSLAPTHPTTIQLTPDHSGSSHTSAEGVEPSIMAYPEHSSHLMVSQWGSEHHPHTIIGSGDHHISAGHSAAHGGQFPQHATQDPSSWLRDDEGAGRAGTAPGSRTDAEILSPKQQEEQRRIEKKNHEVEEWRSQNGGSSEAEDEQQDQSYFPLDADEANNNVPEVDDAASIRENRFQDGQTYYNLKNLPKSEVDEKLMSQSRHWYDPPTFPQTIYSNFQPATSNDAIRRYNLNAETISITSRVATWGTRRRSEPSLSDFGAVDDGSFLKRLSIKPREGEWRPAHLIDQGLDRIASMAGMVRRKSDAKFKRVRSAQNIPEAAEDVPQSRNNSQGSLAPPVRTPSFGRRRSPSINSAIGAVGGSLGAVGNPHARTGSVNDGPTSPKSPSHLGFRKAITRARSRSELVGLWQRQGGPPGPKDATSPPLGTDVRQFQPQPKPKPQAPPEIQDDDEDDDYDDEEQGDDRDMEVGSEQQSQTIVPTYEGFKDHVRSLNPEMDLIKYKWLVSRIAKQQEVRYKNLLEQKKKHFQAIANGNCVAGPLCMSRGGKFTLLDAKGNPRDADRNTSGLQLVTDFEDYSNPGEGTLTEETLPKGVPMPPTRNLPAEFECHLCFKAKKIFKPSDWTKHVHEDVQPFTCTYEVCKEPKSFKRKADWVRHENERHRRLEWWECQVDDCKHPCYRKDNFLQHLVREHKLPEPKQKTKAAIKRAQGLELAWNVVEQCHHETTKKPQDELCKFCGKSFNTWKKLTVHLAKHMEHISLPVLRLVELKTVDANTIISPVEQILTPATPTMQTKMESASPPIDMDTISAHIDIQQFSSAFGQPSYYPRTGPIPAYGMHAQVPQEVTYDQIPLYPGTFGSHPMQQPQGFLSMGGLNSMHQTRPHGSMDSNFPQTKVEQSRFGSMDSAYSHVMPEQNNYNMHQTSGFAMPQTFASAPPVSSDYQTNMLGTSQPEFDFHPLATNGPQQSQQVPMSRAPGSASSYGASPQNSPQYYGHQS